MDLKLYKLDGVFFWNISGPYNLIHPMVKDWQRMSCVSCSRSLSEIIEGEEWVLKQRSILKRELVCGICDEKEKEKEKEKETDTGVHESGVHSDASHLGGKKMPHRIADLLVSIGEHPNFKRLDGITRMEFEVLCEPSFPKRSENNKWLRKLWKHLYEDGEWSIELK